MHLPLHHRAPIPRCQDCCFFARRVPLSRSRLLLARTLTGAPSSHTIAVRGMGAGPRPGRAVSGSCRPPGRFRLSLADSSVCLSPRFYPHLSGLSSPLLDGVPRFGGALQSWRRSRVDQDAKRSLPHSDGCASLRCQPVPSYSTPRRSSSAARPSLSASLALPLCRCRLLTLTVPQRLIHLTAHPQPM